MADTADMAPARQTATPSTTATRTRTRSAGSGATARRRTARSRVDAEPALEEQVQRLQEDVRAIAQSLARIGGEKVNEAQRTAKSEYRNLMRQGQSVLGEVTDEFEAVEKQIKDTIRQRPLTAVLSAMGIGFLIALLTR